MKVGHGMVNSKKDIKHCNSIIAIQYFSHSNAYQQVKKFGSIPCKYENDN